ncbi:gluconokinase [Dyella humi]|uniref:gluconokinase n=1 Tax=Dyella humi TaxID=1770547 RepID=UPI003612FF17
MRAIVIMGVSGCGKSTVAEAICQRTSTYLIEGDAFHPPENIRKMSAGLPLTDADRQGWLERLAQEAADQLHVSERVVLTCSALKRRYRDTLRDTVPDLGFVFLELTPEQAAERVAHRSGHFMPTSLIASQFRDLEPPLDEPLVLKLSAIEPVEALADQAAAWWSHVGWR